VSGGAIPASIPASISASIGAALVALGCRGVPAECRGSSSAERCLWEGRVASPEHGPNAGELAGEGMGPAVTEATKLDETLTTMVTIIGAGLEWSLVDEQARALCSGAYEVPRAPELPAPLPGSWSCLIGDLELRDHTLLLEAGGGVLSLSAVDIGDAASAELFEFAQQRFDGWCAGERFVQLEGKGLQDYYRCSLPEGPYLVIARFPRDLRNDRWQVSIAIVDAG
jgi:hypothetical protein